MLTFAGIPLFFVVCRNQSLSHVVPSTHKVVNLRIEKKLEEVQIII